MKTLTRLMFAAAIAGAAVSMLARMLGSRMRSNGETSETLITVNPEPLRVPLGELLEAQGTRLP